MVHHHRFQAINDVRRLVAVDPADGSLVDCWTGAPETLIQSVAGGFFWWHPRHLFLDALKHFDCVSIGFEHHVKLKSLVLRPVNSLLTLTLAATDKLTVLAPRGE